MVTGRGFGKCDDVLDILSPWSTCVPVGLTGKIGDLQYPCTLPQEPGELTQGAQSRQSSVDRGRRELSLPQVRSVSQRPTIRLARGQGEQCRNGFLDGEFTERGIVFEVTPIRRHGCGAMALQKERKKPRPLEGWGWRAFGYQGRSGHDTWYGRYALCSRRLSSPLVTIGGAPLTHHEPRG